MSTAGSLVIEPIGYLRSERYQKCLLAHQPETSKTAGQLNEFIELNNGYNFEQALQDLDGFSHLWIISHFHQNKSWKPLVTPPRGPARKRGVFATRSPHRPNPLGLTAVRILEITGRKIYISDSDLLAETPIIDLKPYIPAYDSFAVAETGWVAELENFNSTELFALKFSALAAEQLSWLSARKIDFMGPLGKKLVLDPSPHPTRRIKRIDDSHFKASCAGWDVVYQVCGRDVVISQIEVGFASRFLEPERAERIPDFFEMIEFREVWPATG